MTNFSFKNNVLFSHHWSGKFESPSREWIHLTRQLIDYELIVMTDGTLYVADDKQDYVVNKGEYLIIPPTDFQHGYKQSECTFYWLHFHCPSGCEIVSDEEITFDNTMIYVPQFGRLSSIDRVVSLISQLLDSDKRYNCFATNDSFTTAIISEISCQSILYRELSLHNRNSQLYQNISDYVKFHSSEKITVYKIAEYFNYSPRYLSSIFKECSGLTLKHFILLTKMENAKSELVNTNHCIEQIAYNIGFDDAHNFSGCFKKIVGMSPSDYRKSFTL